MVLGLNSSYIVLKKLEGFLGCHTERINSERRDVKVRTGRRVIEEGYNAPTELALKLRGLFSKAKNGDVYRYLRSFQNGGRFKRRYK